jgi:hypothetical protein
MKYLKSVTRTPQHFEAIYSSGLRSDSYDAACFFTMMGDKEVSVQYVKGYISIGRQIDPNKPWEEIERILQSFQVMKKHASQ